MAQVSNIPEFYTPNDITSDPVDRYRDVIKSEVNHYFLNKAYTFKDRVVTLEPIQMQLNITKDHLLDFCKHYCLHGKWEKVEYSILPKRGLTDTVNQIVFTFTKPTPPVKKIAD